MIGLPIGLLYANAGEWLIHKYVLHGLAKDKRSPFAFHWYEHHKEARRNAYLDPHYDRSLLADNPQSREVLGLVLAAVTHAPLFVVAPWFTTGVLFSVANYYRVHKRGHVEPGWAREHLPWHYDHHMGPNQHANWCVTYPWFDWIMGTREPYAGTEREARDLARLAERKARVKVTTSVAAAGTPPSVIPGAA